MKPMSVSNAKHNREAKLGDLIRRQMRSPANARFLNGLAAFKADHRLPDLFRDLLADLDRAEAGASLDKR